MGYYGYNGGKCLVSGELFSSFVWKVGISVYGDIGAAKRAQYPH